MEKRPRHYAAEILKLKTKEERRAALDSVPEHLRDLVRKHVQAAYDRRLPDTRSRSLAG